MGVWLGVCVCVYPIQGVSLLLTQCSQDRRQILNHKQDKAVTQHEWMKEGKIIHKLALSFLRYWESIKLSRKSQENNFQLLIPPLTQRFTVETCKFCTKTDHIVRSNFAFSHLSLVLSLTHFHSLTPQPAHDLIIDRCFFIKQIGGLRGSVYNLLLCCVRSVEAACEAVWIYTQTAPYPANPYPPL